MKNSLGQATIGCYMTDLAGILESVPSNLFFVRDAHKERALALRHIFVCINRCERAISVACTRTRDATRAARTRRWS
jgi:hypothetical protein